MESLGRSDSPLVSVEDYLNNAYDSNLEFVDGVLVERHTGDWLHALIQGNILFALRRKYPQWKTVPELRSSMTGTRYRLPDICVLLSAPTTRYLLDPAFLVVEVLSEGDVMSVYRPPSLVEIEGESISTADDSIALSRVEIFAE